MPVVYTYCPRNMPRVTLTQCLPHSLAETAIQNMLDVPSPLPWLCDPNHATCTITTALLPATCYRRHRHGHICLNPHSFAQLCQFLQHFQYCTAICMRNHRIIIGNVAEGPIPARTLALAVKTMLDGATHPSLKSPGPQSSYIGLLSIPLSQRATCISSRTASLPDPPYRHAPEVE